MTELEQEINAVRSGGGSCKEKREHALPLFIPPYKVVGAKEVSNGQETERRTAGKGERRDRERES